MSHIFLFLLASAIMVGGCRPRDSEDVTYPAYHRGVSVAGGEFGTGPPWAPYFSNDNPGSHGTEYWYNSENTFRYFGEKRLTLLRIPIRWERIQPRLSAPLRASELDLLRTNIQWARNHGCRVVIDIHNFGRYLKVVNSRRTECVIDTIYGGSVQVSTADFCDLWLRLSAEFRDEPAVYAYGLMCEPHDMGAADWKLISQSCVTAVRNSGDGKLILISGDSWSAADLWNSAHGPDSWITDPAGNFCYEAHCYFDSDGSGAYASTYDEELALDSTLPDRGRKRVKVFIDWCTRNKVRGFLGEYGVPADDRRWYDTVLEGFLNDLDAAGMDGCYWAAGEWWGNYRLSVQPEQHFTLDRPQLATLLRHVGAR